MHLIQFPNDAIHCAEVQVPPESLGSNPESV